MSQQGKQPENTSSAPESGTVRNDTSGNQPSDRGLDPGQGKEPTQREKQATQRAKDDPSIASEER